MIAAKTDYYKINIDENSGCISSFLQLDKEYIHTPTPLFCIRMRKQNGEITDIDSFNMLLVASNKLDQNRYEIVYRAKDDLLRARVCVVFVDEIKWNISVYNNSELVVECVDMTMCVPRDLVADGGKSKILWGFNEGVTVDNLELKEKSYGFVDPQYPGKGLMPLFPAVIETQFMSYYDGSHGLYLAAHDNKGYMKGIDFFPYCGGIKLWFRFYTGCDFGEDYKMDYDFVMKTFTGDWYKAADIYRAWFEANKTDRFVPISENKKLPDWYAESPVVITYPVRGTHDTDKMDANKLFPYVNGIKTVEELAKKLNSKIIVILMHWEGTAPWAPPYVWPPYGGEEKLKAFIDSLHKRGHLIGLYCSGLGWTQYSKIADYNRADEFEKENLRSYMCMPPLGGEPVSSICTSIRHGYDLCPQTSFTKKVITEQAKYMMEADVDYIQLLDQNHGGASYFCYSKDHGHPPVPGKWQTDAVNDILNNVIRQRDKVLIGCESAAAESFIPNLMFSDNRFNLSYACGNPVPMYSYIYHRYVNNFMGNQVYVNNLFDYEKNPENLLMRIAYSFCAGDMLTLVLNDDGQINWNWGKQQTPDLPDQDTVIDFVRRLNQLRTTQKKYLHFGEMAEPFKITCENYEVVLRCGYKLTFDRIFTSKWKANDNTWAQFLVNYNDFSIKVGIDINEKCAIIDEQTPKLFDSKEIEVPKNSVIVLTNCFE